MLETLKAVFPAHDYTLLVAIVGLPLVGALVNGLFGKRLGKQAVTLMALTCIGASFLASVAAFSMLQAAQTGEAAARFTWTGWEWMKLSHRGEANLLLGGGGIDRLVVEVGLSIDALSGTMALIVTGVGFLIHLYSTKYMEEDAGYYRFFAYLNLFIFSMLVLILGNGLPVLFVGWEGVGLCSYLLISFWFSDTANAAAGKKAFIANRVGDFGLLVAMALLVRYTGSLSWDGIEANVGGLLQAIPVWHAPFLEGLGLPGWLVGPHHVSVATLVGLALFLGCAGKSAQIPLYVWLPDAMAGPTPVSALIHAATMVTAGIYLVCRMSVVFVASPAIMLTIAVIGVVTAVFAATIAFVQNDIKKVLAYSTVSQLGYMFLGVGVGAFVAGFFHVVTHAFFKACLFLGAGSVIHAMHARIHDTNASQDLRNMGGLKRYLPTTHWTFLVSCLAIAGLPLTSGFFSKDAILQGALTSSVRPPVEGGVIQHQGGTLELFTWPEWAGGVLFALGLIGAVMTAFYMFRLYFLTFAGEFKGWRVVAGWKAPEHSGHDEHHEHSAASAEQPEGPTPHESPWAMTAPLVILGVLAVGAGLWNAHFLFHWTFMDEWLAPIFSAASRSIEVAEVSEALVPALATLAFAAGVGGAYWVYVMQAGAPARSLAEKLPRLYALVHDKWRVDELYDELVVGTLDFIADVCVWVDKYVVDGIIARFSSWVVAASGHLLRLLQTGRVQGYAVVMVVGMIGVGWFVTAPQARVIVDGDAESGRYSLSASPGLGYGYRWDPDGRGELDTEDFGERKDLEVSLERGETRTVVLQVKNAFGRVGTRTVRLERPEAKAREQAAAAAEPAGERLARGGKGGGR